MGRFLLDGRNPLEYEEALQRFEKLEFGEMGAGCKESMLSLVKDPSVLVQATRCVSVAGDRLAETLIPHVALD